MQKACVKKYQQNFSDTRGQVALLVGVYDADALTLTFTSTAPFLILGLASRGDLPTGGAHVYPLTKFTTLSATIQDANSEWLQALFIAMGFSNAQYKGVSNGMTAYDSVPFSEYMQKYLTPAVLGMWYNLYAMPSSEIIQFWKDQHTLAIPANDSRALRELAFYLFENSSLPLWNPSGKYIINLTPGANTEPYFTGLAAYMAANANVVNLLVEQQNAPDTNVNSALGNPLTNQINSINFAGELPDAILWD